MNLLPRNTGEFKERGYWESFFKKRSKSFEWYGDYLELCSFLHKFIKPNDHVLVPGCGNSMLSVNLYKAGIHDIMNIDLSEVVINQMKELHSKTFPNLRYLKMDVTKLEFENDSFSVILDKGTMDALYVDTTEETERLINAMLSEIERVLRVGGRYLCLSLLQSHILNKLVSHFSSLGWPIRVCHIPIEPKDESEFSMPLFGMVFTKFKKLPTPMKPIFECSMFEDSLRRFDNAEEFLKVIESLQQYGVVKQGIRSRDIGDEQVCVELCGSDSPEAIYTIHVVDSSVRMLNKFAVFIVPQGHENEWIFSSTEGRQSLRERSGFQRLAVVTLNRNHAFRDLEQVKSDLSAKVMDLAPRGVRGGDVPFLSVDNEINKKFQCCERVSEISGRFVIEDVTVENEVYRRLIFANNTNLIQSEMRMIPIKERKGGKKKVRSEKNRHVDKTYLSARFHRCMVAGLGIVPQRADLDLLLIGLGGGALPLFLQATAPSLRCTVIELDSELVKAAEEYFNFIPVENTKIICADGLDYVTNCASTGMKYDVIIFDVDNKDAGLGMSSPAPPFVEVDFLGKVKDILTSHGILVLNLACRNKSKRNEVLAVLNKVFEVVFTSPVPQDVNEIVFCLQDRNEVTNCKTILNDIKVNLEKCLPNQIAVRDICDSMETLSIVEKY